MNSHFTQVTLQATGAQAIVRTETIQHLWSGYGKIVRCELQGGDHDTVIVKHVHWPDQKNHPRGWNTNTSHERKVKSYQVETAWYADFAARCSPACRVPACLALETQGDEVFMVLEDLDASGFPARRSHVTSAELRATLCWLAHFHATFMGVAPAGLWTSGTYWHLETRPDEWDLIEDPALKAGAAALDQALKASPYQTFVHGDAKLANFCFSNDGTQVAAVDFQYIGGGCGMKDVAYFIGSCFGEAECDALETELLDLYFTELKAALPQHHPTIDPEAVEQNWRALYPMAWTDFYRFLQGWSPGHWKIHGYSERLARDVLATLTP